MAGESAERPMWLLLWCRQGYREILPQEDDTANNRSLLSELINVKVWPSALYRYTLNKKCSLISLDCCVLYFSCKCETTELYSHACNKTTLNFTRNDEDEIKETQSALFCVCFTSSSLSAIFSAKFLLNYVPASADPLNTFHNFCAHHAICYCWIQT